MSFVGINKLCFLLLLLTATANCCDFPDAWINNYWYYHDDPGADEQFHILEYGSGLLRQMIVRAGVPLLFLRETIVGSCDVFVADASGTEITYVYESDGTHYCVNERIYNSGKAIIRSQVSQGASYTEEECNTALESAAAFWYFAKYEDTPQFEQVDCPFGSETFNLAYYHYSDETPSCENDPSASAVSSGSTLTINLCDDTTIEYHCVASISASDLRDISSAVIFASEWPINMDTTEFSCARFDQTVEALYVTLPDDVSSINPIKCNLERSYEDASSDGYSSLYTTYVLVDADWEAGNPIYVSFNLDDNFADAVGEDAEDLAAEFLSQIANDLGVSEERVENLAVLEDEDGNILVEFVITPAAGPGETSAEDAEAMFGALLDDCPYELMGLNDDIYQTACDSFFSYPIPDGGACESNPCMNGGTCNPVGSGNLECVCPEGFEGTTCETDNTASTSFVIDAPFGDAVGGNHGDFEATILDQLADQSGTPVEQMDVQVSEDANGNILVDITTYPDTAQEAADAIDELVSSCELQFVGLSSETLYIQDCFNPCDPNPCQNGGICSEAGDGTPSCACTSDFEGDLCEDEIIDPCDPNPCENGGICSDAGDGTPSCDCPEGFVGDLCEDDDPCNPNPCENGGDCEDPGNGTPSCACAVGYEGDLCEDEVVGDPCDPNPCENGGVCADGACECPDGFLGNTCQLVDPCEPNPCQNEGTCIVAGDGSADCDCSNGFQGDTCQEEIQACDPNPCVNGNCTDIGGGEFTCGCSNGWSGTTCAEALTDASNISNNFLGLVISVCIVAGIIMAIVIALVIYNWNPRGAAPRKRLTWEEDYSTMASSHVGQI